jgi:glutathione S-transferase
MAISGPEIASDVTGGRMLKIYGRANSINVRKVLWLCDEIGQRYEREDWGRGYKPTSEPEFQKVSIFGVVPVVDDNGFILRESNTIVRYLAAKHQRTDLYSADLKQRAAVEQWMDWAATDIYTAVRPVFLGLQVKMAPFKDDAGGIAAGIRDWARQMQLLETHLSESGPYVTGRALTIGDIPVGLIVNRWFAIPFEKPSLPAVSVYYDRLAERAPYRAHGRNGTP